MEYRCKTISIEKLPMTSKGMIVPLCVDCKTFDCSNPIEKKKINIMGITKELRTYVKGDDIRFVIGCEGFLKK